MKVRTYIRVGKRSTGRNAFAIDASHKPSSAPLALGSGHRRKILPTVAFAIDLDIPDAAFKQAEQVIAEIKIPADQIEIAAEVTQ